MPVSNIFKYREYIGSILISVEDNILHGKIECIRDVVSYEAENLTQLKIEFEAAVDDYLETCEMLGKDPDKTLSGTFNVRVGSERHKNLHTESLKTGKNLNELVNYIIDDYFTDSVMVHNHFHKHVIERKYITGSIEPNWLGMATGTGQFKNARTNKAEFQ